MCSFSNQFLQQNFFSGADSGISKPGGGGYGAVKFLGSENKKKWKKFILTTIKVYMHVMQSKLNLEKQPPFFFKQGARAPCARPGLCLCFLNNKQHLGINNLRKFSNLYSTSCVLFFLNMVDGFQQFGFKLL